MAIARPSTAKIQAYGLWLKERGLRFPVIPAAVSARGVTFVVDTLSDEERSLLDKMIAAMQLPSGDARVLDMHSDKLEQLEATPPRIVVAMGEVAARALLQNHGEHLPVRGHLGPHTLANGRSLVLMQTLHPRDLLRTPADKRLAWADLQLVMERLK